MNVIDEILSEWSYRCHDGIVDMNDPKKIAILKEVLIKEGIDDDIVDAVLNLSKDDPSSEEKKQKALAVLTGTTSETGISDAIAALNDEEKQKVLKYINNKFKDEIKDFLELEQKINKKVGNTDTADIVTALAIKMKEDDSLSEYLSSNNQLSFDLEKPTGDLLTILEDTKLNKNFLSRIILFTPSEGNKSLGVGEIALELFFKNTQKAKVGDIIVDNQLVELKSQSARFSGKGEGRSGNLNALYTSFKTKYVDIDDSSNLASYISDILNNFKTNDDLKFINDQLNKVYPETSNIEITLEDFEKRNINKKLIKKYVASYVALYKNNSYYMLISKESPFSYTLYNPTSLIDNLDNLSWESNITKKNAYPQLNLNKNKSSSDEENFKPKKLKEPETINIWKGFVESSSSGQYVSEDWINSRSDDNLKKQFDCSRKNIKGTHCFLKSDANIELVLTDNKPSWLEENQDLTEELTNYLIKSMTESIK
jgi:hypothetical protein